MPEISLNSFQTSGERLQYGLPKNGRPHSTVSSAVAVQEREMTMSFCVDGEQGNNAAFGTHIREAAGIIRDWMRR